MPYGATKADWDTAKQLIPITDILPFVANPNIPKYEKSSIKDPRKIPTLINSSGEYYGFVAWVSHMTTPQEVEIWENEEDYGVCVVARHVHAIDIDIDDSEYAGKIVDYLYFYFSIVVGQPPVIRRRENSSRCMFLFSLKQKKKDVENPPLAKHIINTGNGVIEFLFHKQHFCLFGTHKDGMRYYIESENKQIPQLTEKQLVELINAINTSYVLKPDLIRYIDKLNKTTINAPSAEREYDAKTVSDLIEKYKNDSDALAVLSSSSFLGVLPNGAFAVTCPMETLHTTHTQISDAAYFPATADTRHTFHCFHSSHGTVTVDEFLESIGHIAQEKKTIAAAFAEAQEEDDKKKRQEEVLKNIQTIMTSKGVEVTTSLHNMLLLLNNGELYGLPIFRLDNFTQQLEYSDNCGRTWVKATDNHFITARCAYDRRFLRSNKGFPRQDFNSCIYESAYSRLYDSAVEFCKDIKEWDGTDYIETLAEKITGAKSEYHTAVFKYVLTAVYGRMSNPHQFIKADAIPVLVGQEGVGKSTLCKLLCYNDDMFSDSFSFKLSQFDMIRTTLGKSIVEVAELSGLSDASDADVKQFITRTYDEWVPKYKEQSQRVTKRYMLMGTSNNARFITRGLGSRRWLPVTVKNTLFDFDWIKENKENFYAQAKHLYENCGGVQYKIAVELAKENIESYVIADPIASAVERYVKQQFEANGTKVFEISQVVMFALGMPLTKVNPSVISKVSSIMDKLCYHDTELDMWVYKIDEDIDIKQLLGYTA